MVSSFGGTGNADGDADTEAAVAEAVGERAVAADPAIAGGAKGRADGDATSPEGGEGTLVFLSLTANGLPFADDAEDPDDVRCEGGAVRPARKLAGRGQPILPGEGRWPVLLPKGGISDAADATFGGGCRRRLPRMLRLLMLRRMLLGLLLRYRSLWLSDHGLFDTALLLMLAPLRSGRRSRLPRSRGQIWRTRRRRIIIRTTIEVSGNGIFEHGYPTLDRRRSASDRNRSRRVPQMPRPHNLVYHGGDWPNASDEDW